MPRWPQTNTYFWQEAPLLRPLALFVAGIICCDQGWIAQQHLSLLLPVLLCCGIAAIIIAVANRKDLWLDIFYAIAFCGFFTSLGWNAYALSAAGQAASSALPKKDTTALTLVRIKEQPQIRPATTKLLVELLAAADDKKTTRINGDALLYVYRKGDDFLPSENDTLLVPSGWQPIRNRGNPFELNTETFQRRRGITAQQFMSPDKVHVFAKANPQNITFIRRTHAWCDIQLKAYIPDSATLGLLQAMLLGDESGFDPELRQAYSQTGIIHIVSISGSHVGVLYLVVTGVLFWIKGRRGVWAKGLISLTLVWLYVLIAGGPPSALRAAMMFTVLASSTFIEREGTAINTLSSAAFALLVYQPAWLFSVGFQLSFLAVLSITLFYRPIYRLWYWPTKWKAGRWAWQAIAASFAAELLTAPLVIYYFHNFPLLFLFANLLAAVLAGICALIGGMAIIALCWWPTAAHMLGMAVTLVVQLLNTCIIRMQDLSVAALQHLQINAAELLLIYVLIIGLAILCLRRLRSGLHIAFASACLLVTLLNYDQYKALRQERLIVYNNGRWPSVEIIRGRYFQTITGNREGYNEKSAHIGYHAWRASKQTVSPYFSISGKRVFVMTDSLQQTVSNRLPVDILILARPLRLMRVGEALRAFAPKEVVLAARPSAYHLKRWTDSCAAHGIALYNVADDGAYLCE